MTNKQKKDLHEELHDEIEETPELLAEPETVSGEEYSLLREQLEGAEARAAENLDGWQRAQAEFVNYKNRVQRDREMSYTSMKGDIFKQVLPVIDDLERALQNRPHDESVKGWVDGIELIYRKLQGLLDAQNVTRIEAKGQPFDPERHEAMTMALIAELPPNSVAQVHQKGYLLNGRLIRPARVTVSKAP